MEPQLSFNAAGDPLWDAEILEYRFSDTDLDESSEEEGHGNAPQGCQTPHQGSILFTSAASNGPGMSNNEDNQSESSLTTSPTNVCSIPSSPTSRGNQDEAVGALKKANKRLPSRQVTRSSTGSDIVSKRGRSRSPTKRTRSSMNRTSIHLLFTVTTSTEPGEGKHTAERPRNKPHNSALTFVDGISYGSGLGYEICDKPVDWWIWKAGVYLKICGMDDIEIGRIVMK